MSIINELQEEADNSVAENNIQAPEQDTSTEVEDNNASVQESEPTQTEKTEPDTPIQSEIENPSTEPEQLPRKNFASEKVAKYNAFVEKTGRDDYKDFEFWQTPTNEVNEEELLRKFLSEKEGMSEKEIAFEMKRMEVPEKDDDFDDEFGDTTDYSEQEILRERMLKKAKQWHEEEFEKLSSNETDYSIPQKLSVEEYEQLARERQMNIHQSNLEGIYETLPTITGLNLQISGNEKQNIPQVDVTFTPDDDFKSEMKRVSEDIGVVINGFYEEGGKLTDPKGWAELAVWAHKPTRDKMIQFAIEQAVLNDRAARSNQRRNVTTDNYQPTSGTTSHGEEDFDNWRKNRE